MQCHSTHLCNVEEDNDRRIADGSIVPRKVESTGFAINTKDRDVVSALIATIQKLASGVKVEATRVVSTCPFFPNKCQSAVRSHGKNPDAVMQSIPRIDKLSIG